MVLVLLVARWLHWCAIVSVRFLFSPSTSSWTTGGGPVASMVFGLLCVCFALALFRVRLRALGTPVVSEEEGKKGGEGGGRVGRGEGGEKLSLFSLRL